MIFNNLFEQTKSQISEVSLTFPCCLWEYQQCDVTTRNEKTVLVSLKVWLSLAALVPVFSTLIGRAPTMFCSEWLDLPHMP